MAPPSTPWRVPGPPAAPGRDRPGGGRAVEPVQAAYYQLEDAGEELRAYREAIEFNRRGWSRCRSG